MAPLRPIVHPAGGPHGRHRLGRVLPLVRHARHLPGLLFVALLLRVLWSASKTPSFRPVAFGIAWFGLALLPASSIFPLAEVANEHRVFFPYIGLTLAVVWGLALLAQRWFDTRPRVRPAIGPSRRRGPALVAVAGNAVGTYERNKVWRTEETLWRDVTEKSPANGRGLMNYGLTQMSQGKYAEAKRLFDRAAFYLPNYANLEINLGIVTDRLGRPEAAEPHFTRALQLQPDDPAPHSFMRGGWSSRDGPAKRSRICNGPWR